MRLIALLIVSLFLTGCYPNKVVDEVGRYQIVNVNDNRAYLLDTVTGKTWMWTTMTKDNEIVGVWIPNTRFYSRQKLSDYSKQVWSEIK